MSSGIRCEWCVGQGCAGHDQAALDQADRLARMFGDTKRVKVLGAENAYAVPTRYIALHGVRSESLEAIGASRHASV